jgi:septum site-determining protein MinC
VITIKGIRQGLLVALRAPDWPAALGALEARLDANPAFFQGGRVALDVGARELQRPEIERARSLLAQHAVDLWALVSTNEATEAAARSLGLVVSVDVPQPQRASATRDAGAHAPVEGLVVRRTLRSGQSLRHPGHIVVIGDVNPGAEIVAGGNIVVWGRVRGLVHAGALGDEDAVICALDLTPTQLRLAGQIARAPDDAGREARVPEMVMIRDGKIIAIPWHSG